MPPKSKATVVIPSKSKAKPSPKAKSPAKAKAPAKAKVPTKVKTPSKAKAKASTATTIVNENALVLLTDFIIFPKLPGELQLMVWKNCHFPRIVTLKPSKSQFPALLHACSDSRQECIKAGYQFYIRDMETGFVISPWKDILLLDRTSFSTSLSYHMNSFHTIKCRQVNADMLKPIEKLAFSVQEVNEIWRQQCFHCFLMTKLSPVFPNLKELIIILRPGPSGADYDDLYEVKDCTSASLKTAMTDIKRVFKNAQDDGKCKDIMLKIMRNEHWST